MADPPIDEPGSDDALAGGGVSLADVPLDDPAALAKFGRLDFVARLVVEGFLIGQHKSPYKGSSVEFVENRQYTPGDEIRHIDWRAYGKTGKYYIKEYEEETNLRCYLLVDASGSMGYAGGGGDSKRPRLGRRPAGFSKLDYARQMAAALAHLLGTQRDAAGLVTFDEKVRERVEPSTSALEKQRLMHVLETTTPGGETSLAAAMEEVLPTLKRRGLVVLLTDAFDKLDRLAGVLKELRHRRHEVLLLQVIAPEEEEFPFKKPTRFDSLERPGHRVLVDPHRLKTAYREQFAGFLENLESLCGRTGVDYACFRTNEPYANGLGAFLDARRR